MHNALRDKVRNQILVSFVLNKDKGLANGADLKTAILDSGSIVFIHLTGML